MRNLGGAIFLTAIFFTFSCEKNEAGTTKTNPIDTSKTVDTGLIVNASFEDNGATATPKGWSVTGDASTSYT